MQHEIIFAELKQYWTACLTSRAVRHIREMAPRAVIRGEAQLIDDSLAELNAIAQLSDSPAMRWAAARAEMDIRETVVDHVYEEQGGAA